VLHAWAQSELFELPSVFELTTSVGVMHYG
jgi:hypothetical protein